MTPSSSDALSIVQQAYPWAEVIPDPNNPSIIGWYTFTLSFQGSVDTVKVDTEGNIWEQEPTLTERKGECFDRQFAFGNPRPTPPNQ